MIFFEVICRLYSLAVRFQFFQHDAEGQQQVRREASQVATEHRPVQFHIEKSADYSDLQNAARLDVVGTPTQQRQQSLQVVEVCTWEAGAEADN